MAANEYYSSHIQSNARQHEPPPLLNSPRDPFAPYGVHANQTPSPHITSPQEDYGYRPYEQSQHSIQSSYYASGGGGREHEQNQYADNIPLRQHPSKSSSDVMMHNHLPDDPAIIDRPPSKREHTRERRGFFSGKIPWVVYTLTTIQIIVFIAELAKNGALTKTPIEIQPQFNPMIGPSPYVLINMGARYVPCMRASALLQDNLSMPCPNSTSADTTSPMNMCDLSNLCGFGDGHYSTTNPPRQWYRFIIPMFLHAGFVHIGFNMLLQLLLGSDMEKEIGSIRFTLVYLSSGIFGFVLGGNFAPEGIASTGASGSLFGIIAIMLLDLLYHWEERRRPWVDLSWIIVDIVISFVLGLLPGLDNFSHIGGFLMGLVLGVCILHSPDVLRRRVGADLPPYTPVKHSRQDKIGEGLSNFVKQPTAFFKGRKPLWWAWWLVRAAALIGVLVGFIVLLENFYKANPSKCSWCQYLSCLNINHWCDIGKLQPVPTSSNNNTSPAKRDFLAIAAPVLMDGWT